jgi:hypothetical protein
MNNEKKYTPGDVLKAVKKVLIYRKRNFFRMSNMSPVKTSHYLLNISLTSNQNSFLFPSRKPL